MAKVNTTNATEVARFLSLSTGIAYLLRSDGTALRKTVFSTTWHYHGRLKSGVSCQDWVNRRASSPDWVPLKRGMMPSFEEVCRMDREGVATATDGCDNIETDGKCIHGYPAWTEVALSHSFR